MNTTPAPIDLRDFLASQALQALIASMPGRSANDLAQRAYVLADAMLKARGNPTA